MAEIASTSLKGLSGLVSLPAFLWSGVSRTSKGSCMLASGVVARRGILCLLLSVLVLVAGMWLAPQSGYAQEEGGQAEAAPAGDAGGGGGDGGHSQPDQGFGAQLKWIIHTSGMIGLFLFILSTYFVAVVVKLYFELQADVAMPPTVVAQCDELVGKKDFMGLFNLVKAETSLFSRLLATGINELTHGISEARQSMEGVGESAIADMEKRISILAVMGSVGPMIGLLGTLKGMIASFSVIAMSDQQIKASAVAEGISEALLLTFEGVILAVPAIFFFSFFKGKVSTLSINTLLKADDYLRVIANATKKKAAAPAPAGAAPAAAAPAAAPAAPKPQ